MSSSKAGSAGTPRHHHVVRYEVRAANHDDQDETTIGWADRLHQARELRDHAQHDYPDGIVLIVDHHTDHAVG